jgi:transcriptional regulator with XRE-family HTH domain
MRKIDYRRLKAERTRRGLTQREAAEQIGVPVTSWARWERGEVRPQGLNLRAVHEWLARKPEEEGSE